MANSRNFIALGLMSGTSGDGIDIALIETNGKDKIILKSSHTYPFSKEFSSSFTAILKAWNVRVAGCIFLHRLGKLF